MQTDIHFLPDRIAFIADVHLGLPGDDPRRAGKVASFIRNLHASVSHLYIVGDLFDFWFEYRHVVPKTAPSVLFELYNLVRTGTTVTLLAGNHDYWAGSYLAEDVGLTLVPDNLVVEHQGIRIYLHHGDGCYPDDHGYRLLKKVLRSRFTIWLFRLIHPDIAHKIAAFTSQSSRQYLAPPPGRNDVYEGLFRDIADKRLRDGFDATVYGHSHVPLVEKRPGGILVLLGDWLSNATYVILENGTFTLHSWQEPTESDNG